MGKKFIKYGLLLLVLLTGCPSSKNPSSSNSSFVSLSSSSTGSIQNSTTNSSTSASEPTFQESKEEALSLFIEFYNTFIMSDYDAEDWAQLVKYYSDGIIAINSATTIEMLNAEILTAKEQINEVKNLVHYRSEAVKELSSFLNTFNQSDYDPDDWKIINNCYDLAVNNINTAVTKQTINGVVSSAKGTMNQVIKLSVTKADGITELEKYYLQFDSEDYDSDNWAELRKRYDAARETISHATSKKEILDAVQNGKNAIGSISSLLAARLTASTALDEYYNLFLITDYATESWFILDEYYNAAKDAINLASTNADINDALSIGRNNMDKVLLLSKVRENANEEIKAIYDGLLASDYDQPDYLELTTHYNTSKDNILKATSLLKIEEAITTFKEIIKTIPKMNVIRLAAIQELEVYYATFNQSDYAFEDWETLTTYFNYGKNNIAAEKDITNIDDIVTNVKRSMVNITTLPDLRSYAIDELTNYINKLKEVGYTAEDWITINNYYKAGINNIATATTKNDINNLITDTKKAIAAVKTAISITKAMVYYNIYLRIYFNRPLTDIKNLSDGVTIISSTISSLRWFEGPVSDAETGINNCWITFIAFEHNLTDSDFTIEFKINLVNGSSQTLLIQKVNGVLKSLYLSKAAAIDELTKYIIDKDYVRNNFTENNWNELQTLIAQLHSNINSATTFEEIEVFLNKAKSNIDNFIVDCSAYKNIRKLELENYAVNKGQSNYEPIDWLTVLSYVSTGKNEINKCNSFVAIDEVLAIAKVQIDSVEMGIQAYIIYQQTALGTYANNKGEVHYSANEWSNIMTYVSQGQAAMLDATTKSEVDNLLAYYKNSIDSVEDLSVWDVRLNAVGEWYPHGVIWIQMGLKFMDGTNISGVTGYACLTYNGVKYIGSCNFTRIAGQVFILFDGFPSDTLTASYKLVITFTKNAVRYGIEFNVVNGARPF